MDKYEKKHQRNLSAYERQVSAIFNQAIKEATLIGVSIEDLADDEILSFGKLPKTKKAVSKMLNTLASNLTVCIVNGVQSSWTLANSREDELCNQVFGDAKDLLTDAQRKRYYSNNGDALQAFLDRKEAGLNLSERVWKYADEFKEEIEMGLDLGIRDGVAANKMQKDLQQYLQHPDMLFRRVRDKHGNLQLSKRAKAYHPGAGVYRSSYKNARRLTVTETNMAYRTADYLRWQQMDFVVGIRVVKSNNHPDTDICDELSASLGSTAVEGPGCYPKDFKFVGWHPHCRCHSESILKTEEELMADNKRITNGEEPTTESVNTVKGTPKAFDKWVKDNKERIENAKTLPYFIRDNKEMVEKIIRKDAKRGELATIVDKIKARGDIDYLPVSRFEEQPNEQQIIERLGGGDKTKGSCSSLAFAYAANKGGMDVLDFRGGESLEYFARNSNIEEIVNKVGGKTYKTIIEPKSGMDLMKEAEVGKEYYLAIGRHAAIVRRKGRYNEYLELQSSRPNGNGWHRLDAGKFKSRFGSKGRDWRFEMVEISKLYNDDSYEELMGYINTNAKKQLKGISGSIK